MSKKKEEKKSLQKRLCAIVDIYMQQDGKQNKKQLKDFIELKMKEIIAFQETLHKKGKQKKAVAEPAAETVKAEVLIIHPSAELVDELQNNHIKDHQIKDATANS